MGLNCSKLRTGRIPDTGREPIVNVDEIQENTMTSEHCITFGPMLIKYHKPLIVLFNVTNNSPGQNPKHFEVIQNAATNSGFDCESIQNSKQLSDIIGNIRTITVVCLHLDKVSPTCSSVLQQLGAHVTKMEGKPLIMLTSEKKLTPAEITLFNQLGPYKKMSMNLKLPEWEHELNFWKTFFLPQQLKLNSCSGIFNALDECDNAVEVSDANKIVQYINRSYEQLTGCRKAEVIGTVSTELRRKSLPKDTLSKRGSSHGNSKQPVPIAELVENCSWNCLQVPGPSTTSPRASQIVYIRSILSFEERHLSDLHNFFTNKQNPKTRNHGSDPEVETPVIELMSTLLELEKKSQMNDELKKPLQKIFKLLCLSELYAPLITRFRDDDKVSSELFEGLVLNGPKHIGHRNRKQSLSHTLRAVLNNQSQRKGTGTPTIVRAALETDSQWNFNIFDLERVTNHRPLVPLAMKIFSKWKVRDILMCEETVLLNWLEVIETNYHSHNPYHNSTHAADVLQASAFFLSNTKISNTLDHRDAVAVLIAAVVHDLDHPGKTSAFLINTRHPLAILYNDLSVLENHHIALTFQLTLSESGCNIFKKMERSDCDNLRKDIVEYVLATDMTRHFELLSKFQQTAMVCRTQSFDSGASSGIMTSDGDAEKSICRILIKCADVSNPARPFDQCQVWALRIVEEYFQQTEEERAKGLPLTMETFDRLNCNIPTTQCRFIDMFIREMFSSLTKLTDMDELMVNLEKNYKTWNQRASDWRPAMNNRYSVTAETAGLPLSKDKTTILTALYERTTVKEGALTPDDTQSEQGSNSSANC